MIRLQKTKRSISTILILSIICLANFPAFAASPTLLQCDINGDGIVNVSDIIEISNYMGKTGTPGWIKQDVDKNGIIQVCDLMFVANYYGQSLTTNGGTTSGGTTSGGTTNGIARIKKMCIHYGDINENEYKFLAQHFDMLDCSRFAYDAAASIKTLNPNIKIVGYYDSCIMSKTYPDWNEVTQHEDWFVHDSNGNRVQPSGYSSNYLMNPSSGWSSYFAQQCKKLLTNYPQFDGIFVDDINTDLIDDGLVFTVSYSKIPSNVLTNWGTSMYQLIKNAQTTIGSHILVPNSYKNTDYCQGITHFHIWEHFIHGQSKAYNENGYGTDGWNYGLVAIDLLHEQAKLGNIIAVNSGCENADSHPVEAKRWMLFTYACFSFAVVDVNKAYYSWQFYDSDSSHGYYSEMDINLGQPIGDYYHVSGTAQVYARQFANYYVAANLNLLGTSAVTFTINGVSHTLSPRTAVFIQK
ncbi:Hypothetical glycosyl hydrolase family 15 [uncultured archaeon]|nr:Hypothetical glycosyl hydrolase family 15 [uncultured archaeon]